MKGVVIAAKSLSRLMKDRKAKSKDKDVLKEIDAVYEKDLAALKERIVIKLYDLLNGKIAHNIYDNAKNIIIQKGAKFSQKLLSTINYSTVVVSKLPITRADRIQTMTVRRST